MTMNCYYIEQIYSVLMTLAERSLDLVIL